MTSSRTAPPGPQARRDRRLVALAGLLSCVVVTLPACDSDEPTRGYYYGPPGGAGTAGSAGAAQAGGASGAGGAAGVAGQGGATAGGASGAGAAGGAALGGSGGSLQGGAGGASLGGSGGSPQGGSGGSPQGGAGGAGGCSSAAMCPGEDSPCHYRTCSAGVCGLANAPPDAPCGGGQVCDGQGACVACNDGGQCASGQQCVDHVCVSGPSCPGEAHLLISQIRTHGVAGPGDEFVELYNPTLAPVALDATWELRSRSVGSAMYTKRWGGNGQVVAPHGYFLIAGTGYAQQPPFDAPLQSGIKDASSVVLAHAGAAVDALCLHYSEATAAAFDATFTCEGPSISNAPHDDESDPSANVDLSLLRVGAGGCLDTDSSAADFVPLMPAMPRNAATP